MKGIWVKLLLLMYCTAFWNRFAGKSFEKGKSKNLQPYRQHSLLRCADCIGLLPLSHFSHHGFDISFCHMQVYPRTYIFTFCKQNSAPHCNNLRTTANTAVNQHYSYRHSGSGLTLNVMVKNNDNENLENLTIWLC